MIKPFPDPAETVFQSMNETQLPSCSWKLNVRMIDKPIEGWTDNPFSWVPERRHVKSLLRYPDTCSLFREVFRIRGNSFLTRLTLSNYQPQTQLLYYCVYLIRWRVLPLGGDVMLWRVPSSRLTHSPSRLKKETFIRCVRFKGIFPPCVHIVLSDHAPVPHKLLPHLERPQHVIIVALCGNDFDDTKLILNHVTLEYT